MTTMMSRSDIEIRDLLRFLEADITPPDSPTSSTSQNLNLSLYTRMYDDQGNSIFIPLVSAHKSDLWSPKRRFIVTDRMDEDAIITPLNSPKTPKMSRMDTFYDLHFKDHNRFVKFEEEGHIYTINGSRTGVISVTRFIDEVAIPSSFDPDFVSNNILNQLAYKDGTSPYSGKTAAEIRTIWEHNRSEASKHGTQVHRAAETYLRRMDKGESTSNIPYLHAGFVAFMAHNPRLKPVAVEGMVYDPNLLLAGSFDILAELEPDYNPFAGETSTRKKTILIDIKTNSRYLNPQDAYNGNENINLDYDSILAGRRYQKGKCHPFLQAFANVDFTHHMVQTNIYADLLEKFNYVKVDEIWLLQLSNRDLDSVEYHIVPVPRICMEPLFVTRHLDVQRLFEQ